MSLTSVHPANVSPLVNLLGLKCLSVASSLDKLATYDNFMEVHELYATLNSDTVMTIEQLRNELNNCYLCGVNWADEHVSLDCSECGGYALERPCPQCDGKCGAIWKRNVTMSNATSKARWSGECTSLSPEGTVENNNNTHQTLNEICRQFELNSNNSA